MKYACFMPRALLDIGYVMMSEMDAVSELMKIKNQQTLNKSSP